MAAVHKFAIPGVHTLDGLEQWVEEEWTDHKTDEIILPEAEFDRIWRIAKDRDSWSKCPDDKFHVPFWLPWSSQSMVMRFSLSGGLRMPQQYTCICTGWDLWRHPTGCKCGAAEAERKAKEAAKKIKDMNEIASFFEED